jgi:hypothetical protein
MRNYSQSQQDQYNLVWSISAMVMAAVTAGVLLILILVRTFKSPLQRLFLVLTVFTLLGLVFDSLNIVLQSKLHHGGLCQVIGYAEVCIFITSNMLVTGIALYFLIVVYYLIQAKPLPKVNRCMAGSLEIVFLLAVVGVPPVALLRSRGRFNVSRNLCWIDTNGLNRDFERKILSTYTAVMSLNVAIFVLMMSVSCLLACRQRHIRSHHIHMVNRAALLNLFLIISFVINVASLWGHYHRIDENLPFWVLIVVALVVPTSPVLIPFGFMFYLSSTKKLRGFRKKLPRLKIRLRRNTEMGSAPPDRKCPSRQSPREPPSYTVSREVEYTGAFTGAPSTYGSTDQTTYSE